MSEEISTGPERSPMTVIYVATATSTGMGRDGHVETLDGKISLDLAYPKELGGSGAGANPEQLVAMGYAACFGSALNAGARRRRVALRQAVVTCSVSLHRSDDDYSLSFDIVARLPGVAAELADSLVAEAHGACPYSKAFNHGAPTRARIEGQPP
jgi:lipoyl-dependent peroxiredoxin